LKPGIRLALGLLRVVATRPSLLFALYDSPSANLIHADIARQYDTDKLREFLLPDILDRIGASASDATPDLRNMYERGSGSVTPYETLTLATLCHALKPRQVLEIGTFEGKSTVTLAANTPDNAQIFTMCLPREQCRFQVGKLIADSGFQDRITQIACNSKEYDFSQLPKMDLVFIDGDHRYDGVKSDSRNAFSILSPRGVIIWDDIDRCHLGATKAAMEACEEQGCQMALISGTNMAIAHKTEE